MRQPAIISVLLDLQSLRQQSESIEYKDFKIRKQISHLITTLGLWVCLHNPDFNSVDFDTGKQDAGTNAYTFSIKDWNEKLHGKGIVTKSGRYGGGIFAYNLK